LFDTIQTVPAHTEARIHQLCTEALSAQTPADVDRIVPELRSALEEHIRLARNSLQAQASTLSVLEAATRKDFPDASCNTRPGALLVLFLR
jgi:hypothetical protein